MASGRGGLLQVLLSAVDSMPAVLCSGDCRPGRP